MNYDDLIAYLDIESGADIRFFDEVADLIESDEHIDYEALHQLFGEINADTVSALFDEYFNEITEGLPGEHTEMYSLLDQIRLELTGILRSFSGEDPDSLERITERFYRFRNWYVYDTEVSVLERSGSGAAGDSASREYIQSVRDAIATARAARFSNEDYAFDFSTALDYDIDYYAMSFADLIGSQDLDAEEEQLEQ